MANLVPRPSLITQAVRFSYEQPGYEASGWPDVSKFSADA